MVEATGVVAPYVASDLATFYEACFVQTNTNTELITVATTLFNIDVQKGTNIALDHVCDDRTNYHPIFVKLNFNTRAPALYTDKYTLEVTSSVDQLLGISSDIPAYFSQGDVTVTASGSTIYSITG